MIYRTVFLYIRLHSQQEFILREPPCSQCMTYTYFVCQLTWSLCNEEGVSLKQGSLAESNNTLSCRIYTFKQENKEMQDYTWYQPTIDRRGLLVWADGGNLPPSLGRRHVHSWGEALSCMAHNIMQRVAHLCRTSFPCYSALSFPPHHLLPLPTEREHSQNAGTLSAGLSGLLSSPFPMQESFFGEQTGGEILPAGACHPLLPSTYPPTSRESSLEAGEPFCWFLIYP